MTEQETQLLADDNQRLREGFNKLLAAFQNCHSPLNLTAYVREANEYLSTLPPSAFDLELQARKAMKGQQ